LGVETLAVVASPVERARLYFRYRPVPLATAADPDLFTHRAFGIPNAPMTPEIWAVVEGKANDLASELRVPVQSGQAYAAINRLDGFEPVETDDADIQRHQAQLTGQFLLDRDGIVRWASIECARDGLAGLDRFPTDEELMAAARAL
jgi:hypothetical protein